MFIVGVSWPHGPLQWVDSSYVSTPLIWAGPLSWSIVKLTVPSYIHRLAQHAYHKGAHIFQMGHHEQTYRPSLTKFQDCGLDSY